MQILYRIGSDRSQLLIRDSCISWLQNKTIGIEFLLHTLARKKRQDSQRLSTVLSRFGESAACFLTYPNLLSYGCLGRTVSWPDHEDCCNRPQKMPCDQPHVLEITGSIRSPQGRSVSEKFATACWTRALPSTMVMRQATSRDPAGDLRVACTLPDLPNHRCRCQCPTAIPCNPASGIRVLQWGSDYRMLSLPP